jgi:hypothetical protein
MKNIDEVILELNESVNDLEMLRDMTATEQTKDHFNRAIGQLKASRTSLISARQAAQAVPRSA